MGLFWGRRERDLDQEYKEALLMADCEESVGIILDFIKYIEVLHDAAKWKDRRNGVRMAERCSEHLIISCRNDELPTVGLKTVQPMICRTLIQLEPECSHDIVQGLFNISVDGKCPEIVAVCRKAIEQLRSAIV